MPVLGQVLAEEPGAVVSMEPEDSSFAASGTGLQEAPSGWGKHGPVEHFLTGGLNNPGSETLTSSVVPVVRCLARSEYSGPGQSPHGLRVD